MGDNSKQSARRGSRGRSGSPSNLPDENSGGRNLQRTRAQSRLESPPLGPTTRVRGGSSETCRTRKHPRRITCAGCIVNVERDSDPTSRLKERSCRKLWLEENCGGDPKLLSIRAHILEWERRRAISADDGVDPVVARESVTPMRKKARRSLSCGDNGPFSSSVAKIVAPAASATTTDSDIGRAGRGGPVGNVVASIRASQQPSVDCETREQKQLPVDSETTTDSDFGRAGRSGPDENVLASIRTSQQQQPPVASVATTDSDIGRAGRGGPVGNAVAIIREQQPIPGANMCDGVTKGHDHALLSYVASAFRSGANFLQQCATGAKDYMSSPYASSVRAIPNHLGLEISKSGNGDFTIRHPDCSGTPRSEVSIRCQLCHDHKSRLTRAVGRAHESAIQVSRILSPSPAPEDCANDHSHTRRSQTPSLPLRSSPPPFQPNTNIKLIKNDPIMAEYEIRRLREENRRLRRQNLRLKHEQRLEKYGSEFKGETADAVQKVFSTVDKAAISELESANNFAKKRGRI